MKLGTQTGSMTNHIYSRATKGQPHPVVGMGATILCWTDRHAATITAVYEARCRIGKEVKSLLHVEVQRDRATALSSIQSECQSWSYDRNPNAAVQCWRFEDGMWLALERSKRGGWKRSKDGTGLRIGEREEYCDPCF